MQLLDHFEEAPTPNPIGKKTYLQYSGWTFVLIGGCFFLHTQELINLFPLFEVPTGWFLMVSLWLTTLILYNEVIITFSRLLFVSVIGFVLSGALAAFIMTTTFGARGRHDLMAGFVLWLFYTLGTLGIFGLLQLLQTKKPSKTGR